MLHSQQLTHCTFTQTIIICIYCNLWHTNNVSENKMHFFLYINQLVFLFPGLQTNICIWITLADSPVLVRILWNSKKMWLCQYFFSYFRFFCREYVGVGTVGWRFIDTHLTRFFCIVSVLWFIYANFLNEWNIMKMNKSNSSSSRNLNLYCFTLT